MRISRRRARGGTGIATQKEVRNRISCVKNIHKITRAMEMVAAARLRRAEQRIEAMRPYAAGDPQDGARRLRGLGGSDGAGADAPAARAGGQASASCWSPATAASPARSTPRSSARALKLKRDYASDERRRVPSRGRPARQLDACIFAARTSPTPTWLHRPPGVRRRARISRDLTVGVHRRDLDRVDLVYNRYVSPLTQYVRRHTLLPLQRGRGVRRGPARRPRTQDGDPELAEAHRRASWVYEPEPEELSADAVRGVRGPLGLSGAARVGRLRARGADDGDAERGRERAAR